VGAVRSFAIQGRQVVLPVEVRDASCAFATFAVAAGRVRRLLATGELEAAEPFPGYALCSIGAVEYRDNDLGRYNEVAIAFLVRRGAGVAVPVLGMIADLVRGRLGAYIHQLPVTTAFSCTAGRDIWGFPKSVAHIVFADEGEQRLCTLAADGAHVLTLSVARGGRFRFREARLDAFATLHGVLRRTPFVASGEGLGLRPGGATLTLGTHSMAAELRALGLPRRPLVSGWIQTMRARFEAAEVVGG